MHFGKKHYNGTNMYVSVFFVVGHMALYGGR